MQVRQEDAPEQDAQDGKPGLSQQLRAIWRHVADLAVRTIVPPRLQVLLSSSHEYYLYSHWMNN